MHRICSGRLRALEIAVERSGMTRARCIAADKPLDVLEVCIGLEKHRGHDIPEEMKSPMQRRRTSLITVGSVEDCTELRNHREAMTAEETIETMKPTETQKRYVRKQ